MAVAALADRPVFSQNSGSDRILNNDSGLVSNNVSNNVSSNAPNHASHNVSNPARVQHVLVRGAEDAAEVEIQTSGAPVAPDTQAITGPDRIVVDFPGALPSAELRALKVNRGALKGVRSGLFFSNPPITRVVLDLSEPRSYQISTTQNTVVVKLSPARLNPAKLNAANVDSAKPDSAKLDSAKLDPVKLDPTKLNSARLGPAALAPVKLDSVAVAKPSKTSPAPAARLQTTVLLGNSNAGNTHVASVIVGSTVVGSMNAGSMNAGSSNVGSSNVASAPVPPATVATAGTVAAGSPSADPSVPAVRAVLPPMPFVNVTLVDGMLRIRSEKATLAQVLFEVQRQTHAEIAIPAGAEREEVVVDLGPAPARDVLAALLNGTPYNFIFVGNELNLERVILTLRQPSY